jgi:hypothetical protein
MDPQGPVGDGANHVIYLGQWLEREHVALRFKRDTSQLAKRVES